MFAYAGDSIDYGAPGNPKGTNSNKSMQVFIQNIDTNYDTIRVGYIVYQVFDVAEAFFFDEKAIPDNGQLTVVHNGNENDIPVNSVNIANLNRTPEIFKTIDIVRNRLFAANARTTKFDLTDEFDARAYRYNSAGIANLYNIDDTYNSPSVQIDIVQNTISVESNPNVSPIDYTLIPETFDCINPFNQEKDSFNDFADNDWFNNAQYKYQKISPVPIIGGKGLNISYQFVTKDMTAKVSNFTYDNKYIEPGFNYAINYTYEFSDTYSYPGGQGLTMDTLKNPLLETLFTGYSRGEVYRFGIVFYDVYGYPSYPLWIGDIKFPFAYEQDDIQNGFGLTKLSSSSNQYTEKTYTSISDYSAVLEQDGDGDTFSMVQVGYQIGCKIIKNGSEIRNLGNYIVNSFGQTQATFGGWFNGKNYDNRMGLTAQWPSNGDKYITFITESSGTYNGFDPAIWAGVSIRIYKSFLGSTTESILFTFPTFFPGGTGNSNPVVVKQLGITFSLDTSGAQFQAIKDRISGYSYVRLKREQSDSTRLGTGCIQPTFGGIDNYLLTPYADGPKWGFDLDGGTGSRVRLGIQTYYTPNIIGGSLPPFSSGDYFRFIGRTSNFGFLQTYAATIVTPDFGDNAGFYVASNDFSYYYSDPPSSLPGVTQGVSTNSYLPVDNKFPIKSRVNAPYSTNSSEITVDGDTFINMASAIVSAGDDKKFTEWGAV